MAIINVRTFVHKNGLFVDEGDISVDTANADQMKTLRELNKKGSSLVVPVLEDGTLDLDGIESMLTPGRRKAADWSDEMVLTAHELADEGKGATKIMLQLYVRHGVEVTEEQIKKTLRQEINTGAEIDDELRARVKVKFAKGARKNKYSDEKKAEVVAWMRDNDKSGVAAEEHFGIHNSQCNTWYRKQYGYRRR